MTIPQISGDGVAEIRDMRGPMIRACIAKALEGSYLHMRVLFEYAGLWPAEANGGSEQDSLAALLLQKLEEAESSSTAYSPSPERINVVPAFRASGAMPG